jgi:hypothetical protein
VTERDGGVLCNRKMDQAQAQIRAQAQMYATVLFFVGSKHVSFLFVPHDTPRH